VNTIITLAQTIRFLLVNNSLHLNVASIYRKPADVASFCVISAINCEASIGVLIKQLLCNGVSVKIKPESFSGGKIILLFPP